VEIARYHQEASGSGHDHAADAPGEILLEEFLKPLGVSQYQLAKAVDAPARRIK
jgi:plasmid maintenance system antidote protein VapI